MYDCAVYIYICQYTCICTFRDQREGSRTCSKKRNVTCAYFPTCQVSVVRFCKSSCPPSYPSQPAQDLSGPCRTATASAVLQDLGHSAAKTDQQKEKGTETQLTETQLLCDEVAVPVCVQEHERYYPTPPPTPHPPTHPPGQIRFAGFGPFSGQNGPPERERDREPTLV